MMEIEASSDRARGAIFEVDRVLGLLVNFTDPETEIKRFLL